MNTFSSSVRFFVIPMALLVALLFTSCDTGLSGTYASQGGLINQTLSFKPGGKVEVSAMGITREGTYEVEGKKVKLTVSGDTTILTIDANGCLDGGGMIGKFCKD